MPIKVKPNVFGLQTRTSEHVEALPAKQQLIDLRRILLNERGSEVVSKVLSIALDDKHPVQGAALKMCMDRLLPISEFEKAGAGSRPTITINIGGLNESTIIEGEKSDRAIS